MSRNDAKNSLAMKIDSANEVYEPINNYLKELNNYFDYPYEGAFSYIYVGIDYFRKNYVQIRLLYPASDDDSITKPNTEGNPPILDVPGIIRTYKLEDVYTEFCRLSDRNRYLKLSNYLEKLRLHLCNFLLESFRLSIKDKYARLYRALCTNQTSKHTDITDKTIFDTVIIPYNNGYVNLTGNTTKGCYISPKIGGYRRTLRKAQKSRKARKASKARKQSRRSK